MSDRLRSTLITVAILIGGFVIMKVLNAQKEIPKRMDFPIIGLLGCSKKQKIAFHPCVAEVRRRVARKYRSCDRRNN